MAITLPSYVGMALPGIGDKHLPPFLRTEMERGIAKQRRTAADVVAQLTVVLTFDTRADDLDFEEWFYKRGGSEWFEFTHPRTLAIVSGRIVKGDIGTSTPSNKSWSFSHRQVVIETVRPAL